MTHRFKDGSRYDFSNLLDFKKAQVLKGEHAGLWGDNTYELRWKIPLGADQQARDWIYQNRQGMENVELPFILLDGFWRTVQVRAQSVGAGVSPEGVEITQIVSKGYYKAVHWDTARIEQADIAESNATSAGGIANTKSATVQRFVKVRFPHIAPEAVNFVLQNITVPSPITLRENVLNGAWRKILTNAELAEDGSYDVIVTIADPQYTLEAYSSFGGSNKSEVFYLWEVPKELAQNILNAWKAQNPKGSSATCDYFVDRRLVNLTLRRSKPDQNTFSIKSQKACSFEVTSEYSFGVASGNIPTASSSSGTSETVRSYGRDDGLFDVVVETRKTLTTNIDEYTAEESAGRTVKRSEQKGYTDKDPVTAQVKGTIERVNISLNQDCSKDAVVERIISKEQLGEDKRLTKLSSSLGTIKTSAQSTIGAKEPQIGQVVNYQRRPNVDGTDDVTERVDTSPVLPSIERVITSKRTIDGAGAKNARTVPTVPTAAPGQRITYRESTNEDATRDYMLITESRDASGLTAEGGAESQCHNFGEDSSFLGISASEKEAQKAAFRNSLTPGSRMAWSARENEDGTWDLNIRIETAPPLTSEARTIRAFGSVTETVDRNIDPDSVPEDPEVVNGTTVNIRVDKNADCSVDYTKRVEVIGELPSSIVLERKDVVATTERVQNSLDEEPPDIEGGPNATRQTTIDTNVDGSKNYTVVVQDPLPQSFSQTYKTKGGQASITVFRNFDEDKVVGLITSLNGDSTNNVSASPNEFGLYDGSVTSVSDADRIISSSGDITNYSYTIRTAEGETYTFNAKITQSAGRAGTHASGSVATPQGMENAGVTYIGKGLFKTVKVTKSGSSTPPPSTPPPSTPPPSTPPPDPDPV